MTIEELRRARLAAKLEAMGGMGGNAETKRKAEVEAEAKAEESLFFDPPADGKMTAEQQQAVLTAKLKELGDYGVKRRTVEESPFFDPPVEIELERSTPAHPPEKADEPKEEVIHPRTKADKPREELIATAPPPPAPRKTKSHKEDLAAFRETYLQPVRISHRKAVYVSDETQQRLDFVVRRIGLRGTSISGYVERVLREHLDGYKDSIEQWRKL
ncbi:hypothetical protein N425_05320 [Tannerella sp. oral taxon BU063 isolate Cell 2]|uniref:DUF3408 domain-containing protein n=1 Tax=Tannerella sp. oral taxon BU063 isolate Cell 2 TaxID=1411148 RepID=W2C738_9BACT|nr:hypothetical protein N425_05330 [Tannerella sp. oral taxon BU063 isolate Cell 2]ETK02261.1 hypothetical protein N425_05320 [Tannerella sp. oral taxon BU063 isolate Cell 2]